MFNIYKFFLSRHYYEYGISLISLYLDIFFDRHSKEKVSSLGNDSGLFCSLEIEQKKIVQCYLLGQSIYHKINENISTILTVSCQ